jgi:hypothetical protein
MPTSTNIGNATSSNTATTYWVVSYFAPINSPSFTGTPLAVTNSNPTDSSTQIATNAFVQNAINNVIPTYTITSLASVFNGSFTSWNFDFPQNIDYGNTISYVITTNNSPTTSFGVTTTIALLGNYGLLTGNAVVIILLLIFIIMLILLVLLLLILIR